jgi:hypothetical protein
MGLPEEQSRSVPLNLLGGYQFPDAVPLDPTLVVVALIGNAVGIPREPAVGPVALAASWTLGCAAPRATTPPSRREA